MNDLPTIRALFVAQYYPTRRGLLVRAVIAALDALIAYDRAMVIREHVARVNGRDGGERRQAA